MAAAVSGGIGFLATGWSTPEPVDPRDLEAVEALFGDFVRFRSYNIAFHHLSPPFQRDLSFLLLEGFLLLLLLAVTRKSAGSLLGAGVTMGMLGLTGGEATFVAFGVAGLLLIAGMGLSRLRIVGLLFGPALAIYALWLVPLLWNYFRFDGFRDQSWPLVVTPPLSIAGAWGLTLILGVYGVIRFLPRVREPAFGLFALFAGAAVALYAGIGAADLLQKFSKVRLVSVAATGLFVVVAATSPLLGSMSVAGIPIQEPLHDAVREQARTVLNRLSPHPGGHCIVASPLRAKLPEQIAAYTGYRLVQIRRPPRWQGLLTPAQSRRRLLHNAILTTARSPRRTWARVARRYGVDVVVTQAPAASTRRLPGIRDRSTVGGYRLLWLDPDCVAR